MKKALILLLIINILLISTSIAQQNTIDSLKQVVATSKQDTIVVNSLISLSYTYFYIDFDTSKLYISKAAVILKKIDNNKFIARKFSDIGFLYYNSYDYIDALYYYKKAAGINKRMKNNISLSNNINYIGSIYYQKGNFKKSLQYYKRSLNIILKENKPKLESRFYGNIGISYHDLGNLDSALIYYQLALKICEKNNFSDCISFNYGNIAILFSDMGNFDKSFEYYNKAIKIDEELGYKKGVATHLGNIGAIYEEKEDYKTAIEYHNKALKISEETQSKDDIARHLGNIGVAYQYLNEIKKAEKYYLKSLKICEEVQDINCIAYNTQSLASIYLLKNEYKKSIEYSNKCIDMAEKTGAVKIKITAYDYLSRAYKGLKQYKKSLKTNEQYHQLKDSIYNIEKTASIAEMQVKYETEKQDKQIEEQRVEIKISHLRTKKEVAEKENQKTQRNLFIIGFILMIIVAVLVYRNFRLKKKDNAILELQKKHITEANKTLHIQNEEITEQHQEIISQRDEIEAQRNDVHQQKLLAEKIHLEISESIDYAKRIQQSILSETKLLNKYLNDHFVLFKPKDKVSGDFYWWTHIENHTVITAVDCTGHGVPGAFMSMLGISFLREIVQKEYITHTGVILRKLRKEIIKSLKQKGTLGEQKDGMDMAIISINHKTNIVQYSGAYNPLYIIRHKKVIVEDETESYVKIFELNEPSDLKLYEIRPDKMPISIFVKMNKFRTHEIQLEKGDQLYMFSDGYADQFGGLKGKKFKYKTFKSLLLANADKPMAKQKQVLNKAFEDWKGNTEQIDDIVVLGVKIGETLDNKM